MYIKSSGSKQLTKSELGLSLEDPALESKMKYQQDEKNYLVYLVNPVKEIAELLQFIS